MNPPQAGDVAISRTPFVIPAFLFVIPVETGIQIIPQLLRRTDIHNISLRFLKFPETSLTDFQLSVLSPNLLKNSELHLLQ